VREDRPVTDAPAPSFRDRLRTRAAASPRRIAFPEAADPRVAGAVVELIREGIVHPVLVGDPAEFVPVLQRAGLGSEVRGEAEVFHPAAHAAELADALLTARGDRITPAAAAAAAAAPLMAAALALRTGRVDGVVAGAVHTTADVLRAAFHAIGPAEGIGTVSSAFYMTVVPPGAESEVTLTFTDCAVVPEPTSEQLAAIAESAVHARRAIVGDEPRVAFLSYATKGSAEGPSVSRIRDALARFRVRMPGVAADGELQGDAAIIAAVGERKAPGSPVAGRANVLVFPDLDAANIAYKLVERLAGAQAIGPVLQGLRRPVNDLSRGARVPEIVDAACVTALLAATDT
jgi:phosphate acetyltransferase